LDGSCGICSPCCFELGGGFSLASQLSDMRLVLTLDLRRLLICDAGTVPSAPVSGHSEVEQPGGEERQADIADEFGRPSR
jgi:hypothetical protein